MHAKIRIAITTAILLALPSVSLAQHRIQWVNTWPDATAEAQRTKRLVLLHFWNYNCPPCTLLERRVFNQPEVIRAIHSGYVPLKVNVAENAKMAEHFKIEKWPTDVIVTPDGKEVFRSVSQQEPHRFVATLHQVSAHVSTGLPIHGYAATPAPPKQSAGSDTNSFPIPGQAPPTPPQNPAPPRNQQPKTAATNPAMIENQFAGPLAQNQPARQAEMAPAYGGQFQVPAATREPAEPPKPPTVDRAPIEPSMGTEPLAPNGTATNPAAAAAANGQPPQAHPEQGKHGPPAMEGFCIVSLMEKEQWVQGDPRWGVLHRGRLYLFANEEYAKKFHTNFAAYAPVLSGYDPVKFLDDGTMVDGKRAHGIFFHNQVILFESEETLQKFWQSPERYAQALRGQR